MSAAPTAILFPSDPLISRQIEPDFEAESRAAEVAGFSQGIVSLEELFSGSPERAVRRLTPADEPLDCLYRGWMLEPAVYARLHTALAGINHRLLTPPGDYTRCHEFPGGYERLADLTPRSLIFPLGQGLAAEAIVASAQASINGAAVVKDYVKSRKHEWLDAFFIPELADTGNAVRVVGNFIQRQGESLHGGVVIREFIPLEAVGTHPKSGMPIPLEFRTFFCRGHVLTTAEYWHELRYDHKVEPPAELLAEVAARIGRDFFSADLAFTRDGRWIVVEIGDGQVSQIPEKQSVMDFYHRLAACLGT